MSKRQVQKATETEQPVSIYLKEADLHKLFHLSSKVEKIVSNIGNIQREAQIDELGLKVAQEQLQRMQAEFALRQQRRISDIQHMSITQAQAQTEYEAFKVELSQLYGVDIDRTTIDDESGRLVVLPDPE